MRQFIVLLLKGLNALFFESGVIKSLPYMLVIGTSYVNIIRIIYVLIYANNSDTHPVSYFIDTYYRNLDIALQLHR